MYKIGIIGDRESVLGFMALGFSVHEASSAQEAGEILASLVRGGEYAVIFLAEAYAVKMTEEIDRYKDLPLPAITVIPGSTGGNGYGMATIRNAVERAVGADILFRNND